MERKNLHDIISDQYGVETTYAINPEVDQVQNTATKILSINPRRLSFVFTNLSPTSVYISPTNDVNADRGILVAPNGGAVTLKWTEDFELVAMDWYGIGAVANRDVYLIETIIQ